MSHLETIQKAILGSREAWGDLYTLYREHTYHVAFAKLRNSASAEDVAQDVWVRGMTRIGQLRDPGAFAGWLRRLVYSTIFDRQRKSEPVELGADYDVPAQAESDGISTSEHVERLLRSVSETDREILTAHYLRGEDQEAIAKRLGIPHGTVRRRLCNARRRAAEVAVS